MSWYGRYQADERRYSRAIDERFRDVGPGSGSDMNKNTQNSNMR